MKGTGQTGPGNTAMRTVVTEACWSSFAVLQTPELHLTHERGWEGCGVGGC